MRAGIPTDVEEAAEAHAQMEDGGRVIVDAGKLGKRGVIACSG